MNGKLEFFFKMIYEDWIPKAILDKKYRMPSSVKFSWDALMAMAED